MEKYHRYSSFMISLRSDLGREPTTASFLCLPLCWCLYEPRRCKNADGYSTDLDLTVSPFPRADPIWASQIQHLDLVLNVNLNRRPYVGEFGGIYEQINNISAVFTIPASHDSYNAAVGLVRRNCTVIICSPHSTCGTRLQLTGKRFIFLFGLFVFLIKEGRCAPTFAGI